MLRIYFCCMEISGTYISKEVACYHCGDTCPSEPVEFDGKHFCCEGCKTVYEILNQNGLCTYYDLEKHPGLTLKPGRQEDRFAYLEIPEVESKLLDYADGQKAKVTFYLPGVHCASCIWLLENLHKLHPGISHARVNFVRKEIYLTFIRKEVTLRQLVELLASIGYEPEINLESLEKKSVSPARKSFFYKLGIAGFCFGNIMLLSFPEYLGLDWEIDTEWGRMFGYLQWLLVLPVFFYSSSVFFQSAYLGLRQSRLNIDVPVSLGILVLFLRSSYDIFVLDTAGYLDSLAGLVFFLLAGKWFQQKTYDSLSFDRDYKAYFPVAATRIRDGKEEKVILADLAPGDTISVKNLELIPADARLLSAKTSIDYSFVTGESDPVEAKAGDLIYAGGRQTGTSAEFVLTKDVSQSYLTQLWNQEAFQEEGHTRMENLADRFGRHFTVAILLIAVIAGLYWLWADASRAVEVFTALLIIACPCALALAGPITFGNAIRILGRWKCYVKNTRVIEIMASVNHVVFDKTGTITQTGEMEISWEGEKPGEETSRIIGSLAAQSLHPVSQAVFRYLGKKKGHQVEDYHEEIGAGVSGRVAGHEVRMGLYDFVYGANDNDETSFPGTFIMINGKIAGRVIPAQKYRNGLRGVVERLAAMKISMITGDNDRELRSLKEVFGEDAELKFRQSPREKLSFVQEAQNQGSTVMMIGDGLNDAGALKQADVGVALAENVNYFSPACDMILDAGSFKNIPDLMAFSRTSLKLVKGAVVISLMYNIIGLSFAVQGLLSPIVAAILMPVSSISIVIYGLSTTWLAASQYRSR